MYRCVALQTGSSSQSRIESVRSAILTQFHLSGCPSISISILVDAAKAGGELYLILRNVDPEKLDEIQAFAQGYIRALQEHT